MQKRYLEAKLVANETCDACEAAFEPGTISKVYQTDEKGLCEHGKRVERKTPDGRKIYTYRCTGESQDRDKEVISPDGWDFEPYEKNPVILDSHSYGDGISAIIGCAIPPLRREGTSWDVDVVYAKSPLSRGPLAKDLVDEGMLKAVSVGFISIESEKKPNEPRKHLKQELLEISNVAIPSYRDALRVASFAGTVQTSEFGVKYLEYLSGGGAPLPNEQIELLSGVKTITDVSEKAADFNTVLASADREESCRERRWDLNRALNACLKTAAEEEGLTAEQRTTLADTSLGQYHAAMLEWFKAMIALPAETVSAVVEYMSADDPETKAGAKLSAKSKGEMQAACDELQSARDRLMKMMAEPEPEEHPEDMPKAADPPEARSTDPETVDPTEQVSEPDITDGSELTVDLSAIKALREMEV